ncbi:hypothetical protein THASP1DRAFT_29973 [Thamnocephalis sphaerospora]|uniref:Cep57 centrosome microtubule-binding domain-containing protein n=1 Tax=Thamnocephalis sphaerospora TaxID=78915 RepID=A0A4P9XQB5_9FUNG|nr:hypothetical protein THASP1DRAFT_29973 [Thamnocephalis sphaerospora]|eukprot:RKP08225.1 hypothetical protein THASP1DRAFT_29973 [Thamnocephalis sphaerospora]
MALEREEMEIYREMQEMGQDSRSIQALCAHIEAKLDQDELLNEVGDAADEMESILAGGGVPLSQSNTHQRLSSAYEHDQMPRQGFDGIASIRGTPYTTRHRPIAGNVFTDVIGKGGVLKSEMASAQEQKPLHKRPDLLRSLHGSRPASQLKTSAQESRKTGPLAADRPLLPDAHEISELVDMPLYIGEEITMDGEFMPKFLELVTLPTEASRHQLDYALKSLQIRVRSMEDERTLAYQRVSELEKQLAAAVAENHGRSPIAAYTAPNHLSKPASLQEDKIELGKVRQDLQICRAQLVSAEERAQSAERHAQQQGRARHNLFSELVRAQQQALEAEQRSSAAQREMDRMAVKMEQTTRQLGEYRVRLRKLENERGRVDTYGLNNQPKMHHDEAAGQTHMVRARMIDASVNTEPVGNYANTHGKWRRMRQLEYTGYRIREVEEERDAALHALDLLRSPSPPPQPLEPADACAPALSPVSPNHPQDMVGQTWADANVGADECEAQDKTGTHRQHAWIPCKPVPSTLTEHAVNTKKCDQATQTKSASEAAAKKMDLGAPTSGRQPQNDSTAPLRVRRGQKADTNLLAHGPLPMITRNLQHAYSTLKSHDPSRCTVCTRKARGVKDMNPGTGAYPGVHASDESVEEEYYVDAFGGMRSPDRTARRALRIAEDEFRHLRMRYNDLLQRIDAFPSEAKYTLQRHKLAGLLREATANMEVKSDQIASLQETVNAVGTLRGGRSNQAVGSRHVGHGAGRHASFQKRGTKGALTRHALDTNLQRGALIVQEAFSGNV